MTVDQIKSWFNNFTIEKGNLTDLLDNRRKLAIIVHDRSVQRGGIEINHAIVNQKRKLNEEYLKLKEEGTIMIRTANAMIKNKEYRLKEATYYGQMKALQYDIEGLKEILNAMAGYIGVMRGF